MSVFQEKKELHELGINKEVTIKIHYLRKDNNYDGWNVWVWNDKGLKKKIDFFEDTEDNSNGRVATLNIGTPEELDKIGYIIRRSDSNNEWAEKEGNKDRFILMKNIDTDGSINAYIKEGEEEVKFKRAKEQAEKDMVVRVHYQRPNNDYSNWNIWAWENDEKGQRIEFNGEDDFGKVAQFNVSKATYDDKLGFILRKSDYNNEWAQKDEAGDRFVDLRKYEKDGKLDIYIKQGEPKIYFERPILVRFHYKRYDKKYDDGWDIWVWKKYIDEIDEPGCGVDIRTIDESSYGNFYNDRARTGTYLLGNTKGVEKLGFLVRKTNSRGKWIGWDIDIDRYVDIDEIKRMGKDGVVDIYLAQGDLNVGFSEKDIDLSPRIVNAIIKKPKDGEKDGFKFIDVELSKEFDLTDEAKADFELRSGKDIVPIRDIQYMGEDKEKTTRWITIEVMNPKDIKPFDKKYEVSVQGFKSLPVSIRRLYEHEDFIKKLTYDGKDDGVTYSKESSKFRIYSPSADFVELLLYKKGTKSDVVKTYNLNKDVQGTWFLEVKEDLKGMFYKYRVSVDGVEYEVVDPNVKVTGVNGERGAIIDFEETNPKGWEETPRPKFTNPTDAIITELHIRDYTVNPNSGVDEEYRGRYLGLAQENTVLNTSQQKPSISMPGLYGDRVLKEEEIKTGLAHLKEMGYTHVQLMPIMNFDGVDETIKNPKGYNWGYNTLHWNAPAGSYATDTYDPAVRVRELKQLIQTLHKNGLRVVMDVVYNHTFKTQFSNLNILVPKYYHRTFENSDIFSNVSNCANDIASEKKMTRKLIINSVLHWAKEYKIDGFRFDVMYLLDIDTMNAIKEEVHKIDPSILLYGEGWGAKETSPISEERLAKEANSKKLRGIGFFSNWLGSAIKGSFDGADRGFASNAHNGNKLTELKRGIVGGIWHPDLDKINNDEESWKRWKRMLEDGDPLVPSQMVNYVGAHDNLTLYDKIDKSAANETDDIKAKMYKLCYSTILTTRGLIMIPEGDEFMRTKFGNNDSYSAGDAVNGVNWERKRTFKSIFEYIKGLIKLRKEHPAFRMSDPNEIREKLTFLKLPEDDIVGYTISDHANGDVSDKIVVVHNGDWQQKEVKLPCRGWSVLVNGEKAGTDVIENIDDDKVIVPAHTTMVLSDSESLNKAKDKEKGNGIEV